MMNRLRQLRKNNGLTQRQFAKEFNEFVRRKDPIELHDGKGNVKQISYSAVSRWENGSVVIPSVYSRNIASFFNVPIGYLQGLDGLIYKMWSCVNCHYTFAVYMNARPRNCPFCKNSKQLNFEQYVFIEFEEE